MLFSEPKISQSVIRRQSACRERRFSALQRAENFSIVLPFCLLNKALSFSALQRAENFSIATKRQQQQLWRPVSVLFSEPKISQSYSLNCVLSRISVSVLFSEPKISQLQTWGMEGRIKYEFQCSSASRKFLNRTEDDKIVIHFVEVSVLFSEPKISQSQRSAARCWCSGVSVLFSEPKISQLPLAEGILRGLTEVSVLFSEPKISQFSVARTSGTTGDLFQCSSASRKFLNSSSSRNASSLERVSVLFSEPKISQSLRRPRQHRATAVSVLFSEPKISQFRLRRETDDIRPVFQCSSASRKFLN